MKDIQYRKTDETPLLDFRADGQLMIEGVSIPENVHKFYKPVIDWLGELGSELPAHITLTFHIEYMNTSSTRFFVDIIKKVNSFSESGSKVELIWLYDAEDEDAMELGEELAYSAQVAFVFKTT